LAPTGDGCAHAGTAATHASASTPKNLAVALRIMLARESQKGGLG
jgi:hypothetical protein